MKKLALISGILSLLLGILLLTGFIPNNNDLNNTIIDGNRFFKEGEYIQAIEKYNEGLVFDSTNKDLQINIGLSYFMQEQYEEALPYFINGEADLLVIGNTNYLLGNNQEDINQKMSYYEAAINSYKDGIIKESNRIDLKYNYEFVSKLLEEQKEENQEDQEDQEDQEEQEEQEQEQEENQEQENQESNQEDGENQEENDSQEEEGQEESESEELSEEELEEQSKEAIEQILRILAQEEEESLKNNQELKDNGKDDTHDW